ncbi:MAG: UPF0262 family protein [Alphaproteobacteria bacterium]|nr:UPF0262 family protein [Alphaproteobacteria bacterium]
MARITKVTLDDASIIRRTPEVEHERRVAMADLVEDNRFALRSNGCEGPYELFISVRENRLTLRLTNPQSQGHDIVLPLAPFRGIIKDYFMICESYFEAIKHATSDKIQTIDMARRGVHNEGSEQLQSLLDDAAAIDFDTARRLFTLICVLHIK